MLGGKCRTPACFISSRRSTAVEASRYTGRFVRGIRVDEYFHTDDIIVTCFARSTSHCHFGKFWLRNSGPRGEARANLENGTSSLDAGIMLDITYRLDCSVRYATAIRMVLRSRIRIRCRGAIKSRAIRDRVASLHIKKSYDNRQCRLHYCFRLAASGESRCMYSASSLVADVRARDAQPDPNLARNLGSCHSTSRHGVAGINPRTLAHLFASVAADRKIGSPLPRRARFAAACPVTPQSNHCGNRLHFTGAETSPGSKPLQGMGGPGNPA
jgi:hypothetical protein